MGGPFFFLTTKNYFHMVKVHTIFKGVFVNVTCNHDTIYLDYLVEFSHSAYGTRMLRIQEIFLTTKAALDRAKNLKNKLIDAYITDEECNTLLGMPEILEAIN